MPGQNPSDGWAPIEKYLRLIREGNPSVKVLFEHRSDLIKDEELEACYAWVDEVLNGDEKVHPRGARVSS